MRAATDLLIGYARYHRDERNIASHFVGVPMIVFSLGVLLARPSFALGGLTLSPAWIVFAGVALWYIGRGLPALGIATSAVVGFLVGVAHQVAHAGGVAVWFGWGVGVFMLGWLVQAVGHWYEGRKPAFVDDLIGLLVGPMFMTAETLFALGWNKPLSAEIERRAGPTVVRDLARIA